MSRGPPTEPSTPLLVIEGGGSPEVIPTRNGKWSQFWVEVFSRLFRGVITKVTEQHKPDLVSETDFS